MEVPNIPLPDMRNHPSQKLPPHRSERRKVKCSVRMSLTQSLKRKRTSMTRGFSERLYARKLWADCLYPILWSFSCTSDVLPDNPFLLCLCLSFQVIWLPSSQKKLQAKNNRNPGIEGCLFWITKSEREKISGILFFFVVVVCCCGLFVPNKESQCEKKNLMAPYCAIPRDYLSNTPYCALWGFWRLNMTNSVRYPSPFSDLLPLGEHAKWRWDTPRAAK